MSSDNRHQSFKEKPESSPKPKKDSSDFSFSYDCKINFMHAKIYFYATVLQFGTKNGFLCRKIKSNHMSPAAVLSKTDVYHHKIRYDIYCPSTTIAEHLHTICSYWDLFYKDCKMKLRYDSKLDGNKVSFTSRHGSLLAAEQDCTDMYRWTIESLEKLFRTKLNLDDYPVQHVRVHIKYRQPEIAKFVYNQIYSKEAQSNTNISEITLEDEYTIGVTCKTLEYTTKLWTIFIGVHNLYYDTITLDDRIKEYNSRNSLEHSTNSLITSICVMIMFIGLVSKCCT